MSAQNNNRLKHKTSYENIIDIQNGPRNNDPQSNRISHNVHSLNLNIHNR